MTCPGTRSPLPSRGSWAAAGRPLAFALAGLILGACSTSDTGGAIATPSPTPSAAASPSPSPTPSGSERAVASQVLPPATDQPVAKLCSTPVTTTSDGNAAPLFCQSGALNVLAWAYYGAISSSILSLGLNPNDGQPQAAMCDDIAHNGAKPSQEASGYRLAAAYYGWSFTFDPTQVKCP